MSVPYEKIVEEDLSLGVGEVEVTMPAGGSATGHKIGPHTFSARAFAATLGATQAIGATTDTLELDSEELDTDDWYNPVTFEFQPDVAGIYLITGQMTIGASLTGTAILHIYRGAAAVANHTTQRDAAAATIQVVALVTMNGDDDVVTMRAEHNNATSLNITAANMSGILLNKLDI